MKTNFNSFWMAGFECADHLNASGNRVDMLEMTNHLELLAEDYARIRTLGIGTVREGIRWSVVEYAPYQYNFETVREMMKTADRFNIQQIWDICHFGYPLDLSPFHPHFTARFVALCEAFVQFHLSERPLEVFYLTPINEVSFISWLGGEVGSTVPYCKRNGWELKYALMRAYIAAVKAMKRISNLVRIITTEPLVNMVPELDSPPEEVIRAAIETELQFQSTDMLMGLICPELGGNEGLVDVIGYNYYYNNQWILGKYEFLGWNDSLPDPRWRPLADMLEDAYHRYQKPIMISETSHPKEDRPIWMKMIATECAKLIDRDVALLGVCLYPIIDRPDWDHPDHWHHAGIWDMDLATGEKRVLHVPSAMALSDGQQRTDRHMLMARVRQSHPQALSSPFLSPYG